MDEGQEFIDLAQSISISGRWKEHNDNIISLSKSYEGDDEWYLFVFSELTSSTFSEYKKLKSSHDSADLSQTAWRARNLLELKAWAFYCSYSRDNALSFRADGARDSKDLFSKLSQWADQTDLSVDWQDKIPSKKIELEKFVKDNKLGSIDKPYKRVRNAAQLGGFENDFDAANKILSKFAHPTALILTGFVPPEMEKELEKGFFSMGCANFYDTFQILEIHISNLSKQ